MVEVEGLEPPAPWSQTTCATKLRYTSKMAEKEGFEPSRPVNRTYSLSRGASSATWVFLLMAEGVGFEPTAPFGVADFQDQFLKPLGHPSKTYIFTWKIFKKNGVPEGIRTPGTWLRRPLLYPAELQAHILERVKGIEPSQPAWKAGALPLSYTRISWWKRLDLNQCRHSQRIYSPPPLTPRALFLNIKLWSWR